MAVITEVADDANTLFWKDKWFARKNIQDIEPHVYAFVSKRTARRSVLEALINEKWIEDIQGTISPEALMEYLILWDVISEVNLQVGVQDKHIWRLLQDNIHHSWLMMFYFRGLFFSDHMRGFGSLGLHPNATSSCG
jgi:hypothetical protein